MSELCKLSVTYFSENIFLNTFLTSFSLPDGFSSNTLLMKNIIPVSDDIDIPNIRKQYTVTEKADGERRLMFISSKGKCYFIDTNMNVLELVENKDLLAQ